MKIANILLLLCICILACKQEPKVENIYYESGELKSIKIHDTPHDFSYTEYYKNGNLKKEGKIQNDTVKGKWKEWYADGKLKWEGYYLGSARIVCYNEQTPNVTGLPSRSYVDSTYWLRINLNGIHPEDMIVSSDNGIIKTSNDRGSSDFRLIPESEGNLELNVYVFKDQELYKVGKQIFTIFLP